MDDTSHQNDRTNHGRHDPINIQHLGEGDVSTFIVETVACLLNTDPRRLKPMYNSVDTELLNDLCREARGLSGSVTFEYHGFRFTVTTESEITVRPKRGGLDPEETPRSGDARGRYGEDVAGFYDPT